MAGASTDTMSFEDTDSEGSKQGGGTGPRPSGLIATSRAGGTDSHANISLKRRFGHAPRNDPHPRTSRRDPSVRLHKKRPRNEPPTIPEATATSHKPLNHDTTMRQDGQSNTDNTHTKHGMFHTQTHTSHATCFLPAKTVFRSMLDASEAPIERCLMVASAHAMPRVYVKCVNEVGPNDGVQKPDPEGVWRI